VTDQELITGAKFNDTENVEYQRLKTKYDNDEDMSDEEVKKYDDLSEKIGKTRKTLGLAEPEQKEYDENVEKIAKATGTAKRIAASNPELAGGMFMDDEQARQKITKEGKKVPITLEKESLDQMRKMMLDTFAKGFSPQNARSLLEAVAKANNMEHFEKAVTELRRSNPNQFTASLGKDGKNTDLKRWMQNNAGKALFGNLHTLFGVPKLIKKRNGKPIEETEDEEDEETSTK
jgi:membrane-associated HD superfamily phosphohydrolase